MDATSRAQRDSGTCPGRNGVGPTPRRTADSRADNDKGRKVVMAQWSRHLESIIDTVAIDIDRRKPETDAAVGR